MPDSPLETYNRLLQAPDQLRGEVQRVVDAGVREWTSLATLDAIDPGEELGMLWDVEAERRRAAVRAAFGDVDRHSPAPAGRHRLRESQNVGEPMRILRTRTRDDPLRQRGALDPLSRPTRPLRVWTTPIGCWALESGSPRRRASMPTAAVLGRPMAFRAAQSTPMDGGLWRNSRYNRRMDQRKPITDVSAELDIPLRTLQRWLNEGKLTPYKVEGDRCRYVDVAEVRQLREAQAQRGVFWTVWVRLRGVPAAVEAQPPGSLGLPYYTDDDVEKLTSVLARESRPAGDEPKAPWLVTASLDGQDIAAIFSADFKPTANELVRQCQLALMPRGPAEFVWQKDLRSQVRISYQP